MRFHRFPNSPNCHCVCGTTQAEFPLLGNFRANVFFFGAEVAVELERDFLSLCSGAREVTAVNRQGISRRQRLTEGVGRVLAPLL